MGNKIQQKLEELVDELEQEYGNLEGFEVKLEHPVKDGKTEGFAFIKEFSLYYLTKENILKNKDNKRIILGNE